MRESCKLLRPGPGGQGSGGLRWGWGRQAGRRAAQGTQPRVQAAKLSAQAQAWIYCTLDK